MESNLNIPAFDVRTIPNETVLEHPLVKEFSQALRITDFEMPYIIKGKTLFDEGIWNNHYVSREAISRALSNTDWSDRHKRDLFLDHEDNKVSEWVGEIVNPRFEQSRLVGDVVIHDWTTAVKMQSGKPKFGISPRIKGKNNVNTREILDFVFDNFSIVINPAVKTAYINNMEGVQTTQLETSIGTPSPEVRVPAPNVHISAAPSTSVGGSDVVISKIQFDELMGKFKTLEAKVSEQVAPVKAPEVVLAPVAAQFTELDRKLASFETRMVEAMSRVSSLEPDRRSVNSSVGSANADAFRAKVGTMKGNVDLAFGEFIKKLVDGAGGDI